MYLILVPTANWQQHERIKLPWGLHSLNGRSYFIGRTQRSWFLVDTINWECSDLIAGDIIKLNGKEFEVAIES